MCRTLGGGVDWFIQATFFFSENTYTNFTFFSSEGVLNLFILHGILMAETTSVKLQIVKNYKNYIGHFSHKGRNGTGMRWDN